MFHAAFGIAQVMERNGQTAQRVEEAWTGFGLEELARGVGRVSLDGDGRGTRREGKRKVLLLR